MKRYYGIHEQITLSCMQRARLKECLAVTVGGLNIYELTCMPVNEIYRFFDKLTLSERSSSSRTRS